MSDTINAAIISFGSAACVCLLNLLAEFFRYKNENKHFFISLEANRKNNQKNVSIEYITNKRVEWLYEVRNVLAEYIALSQECANRIMKSENAKIPKSIYRKINIRFVRYNKK